MITGKTVQLTDQQKTLKKKYEDEKELVNYVFATHKKLKLGPGEYDSKFS